MDFEKIKDNFDKVEVNTTATCKHVAEIECAVCIVKVHNHCVISDICIDGYQFFTRWWSYTVYALHL